MNSVRKNTWLVRAAAVAIFVLGFAAGSLAPAAYRAWVRDHGQVSRQDRLQQMSERLKLSPEQRAQVQQIFGETRSRLEALRKQSEPQFADIRRQADERLRQVLTPEQWQQFQQVRDEIRSRGHRDRDRDDAPQTTPEH